MSEPDFAARMAAHGLRLPDAEVPKLEAVVADLERAAAAIRAVQRSYAEEPVNVFRLAPAPATPAAGL
jgi:hypothetical protein